MRMKNQDLIKKWESLKLEAYLPTPNDVWTIGWGHTDSVKKGDKITQEQAQRYFELDIAWAENAVNSSVKVPLNQDQYDALVSLIFNIGATAFKKSTLLKKLNAKDYAGAADQFLVWNKQKGKVLKGLVRRRNDEREVFLRSQTVDGPASATVDKEEKPSILKDKDALAGGAAVIASLGSLTANTQVLAVAAVVLFAAFVIWRKMRNG